MKTVKTIARLVAIAVLYVIYTALSVIVFIPLALLPLIMGLMCAIARDALNDAGRDGDSTALDYAKTFMQAVNRVGRSYRDILIRFGKF